MRPGKANSALLLKRVGVFNIVERRRTCHPGTSLAFHQSAISFFWGGCCYFSPSRPHWLRAAIQRLRTKLFFIVVQFKNQLLFRGNLTGNLDFTEVDVFPIKAVGILWNLFVMHAEVLLLFNCSLLHTNWISKSWLVFEQRNSLKQWLLISCQCSRQETLWIY